MCYTTIRTDEIDELANNNHRHRSLFRSYDLLAGRFHVVSVDHRCQCDDNRHHNADQKYYISVRQPHRFILLKLTKHLATRENRVFWGNFLVNGSLIVQFCTEYCTCV